MWAYYITYTVYLSYIPYWESTWSYWQVVGIPIFTPLVSFQVVLIAGHLPGFNAPPAPPPDSYASEKSSDVLVRPGELLSERRTCGKDRYQTGATFGRHAVHFALSNRLAHKTWWFALGDPLRSGVGSDAIFYGSLLRNVGLAEEISFVAHGRKGLREPIPDVPDWIGGHVKLLNTSSLSDSLDESALSA